MHAGIIRAERIDSPVSKCLPENYKTTLSIGFCANVDFQFVMITERMPFYTYLQRKNIYKNIKITTSTCDEIAKKVGEFFYGMYLVDAVLCTDQTRIECDSMQSFPCLIFRYT